MQKDFKRMRLQKIASKLQQLESSLSPVHSRSLSPLNKHNQLPSFTIENENEFISNSRYSGRSRNKSRGISHRSISRNRTPRSKLKSSQYSKSKRNPHLEFFARSEILKGNRNKQQQKYESDLKKISERSKMTMNSKILLEKIKMKKLEQIMQEESDKLDFGGVGRVLDRIGLFEYLKLDQQGKIK